MPRLFGTKLRFLRRRSRITQVALAQKLGLMSHAHIANLEAERETASLDLVVRVAQVFHQSTDYLLRDSVPVESAQAVESVPGEQETSLQKFGSKLRSLRLQGRLSQTGLANMLGLARKGYISNLEAGRKLPSLDLVVQIADLFKVTTDYLLRDAIPVEEGIIPPPREIS